MKKYLKISNEGLIDLNAFYLIGASTKRGEDGKIGFFGSGLKYGLAVLLRNKVDIQIYRDMERIKLSTRKKNFRGKEFNQIYIASKMTGLTLEMGIDWDVWYSIREIYSNSLDEPGSNIEVVEEIIPEFDKTCFFIEINAQIQDLLSNWEKFFSQKREDLVFMNDDLKVFCGGDEYILYRKGIRCHYRKYPSLFHYDMKDIEINESRTLKSSIDDTWHTAEVVMRNANKEIIRKIYDNETSNKRTMEHMFRWREGWFNEDWLKVIGGRRLVVKEMAGHYQKEIAEGNVLILRKELVDALVKQFKNKIEVIGASDNFGEFHIIEANQKQRNYINEAKEFLARAGVHFSNPVEVAVFEDKSILGSVNGDTILIADRCFEQGKKEVCEALYEEYVHVRYKYNDCTRNFQTFLINQIVSMMEEKQGVYF